MEITMKIGDIEIVGDSLKIKELFGLEDSIELSYRYIGQDGVVKDVRDMHTDYIANALRLTFRTLGKHFKQNVMSLSGELVARAEVDDYARHVFEKLLV